jgi:hypothetical protein
MGDISFTCDRCKSQNFGISPSDVHIRDSVYHFCDECAQELISAVKLWLESRPWSRGGQNDY